MVAAGGADRDQRLAAFRALGAQGNTARLEEVSLLLKADPGGPAHGNGRPPMLRYLEALPADQILPRARGWLGHGGGAGIAAQGILARHARTEDRALVEATLAKALEEGAIYRACSMVEALTVIADSGSTELLVQVFERIPYSWARPRVLRALRAGGSEAAEPLAVEALWDCDSEARELGAEMASLGATPAAQRLQEMSVDPWEDNRVQAAAQGRLR